MRDIHAGRWIPLWAWLVFLALPMQAGHAKDDALAARLQQLPVSVGENVRMTQAPGETWVDIGVREHVGYEHLSRANPGGFGEGQEILVPGRHLPQGLTANGLVLNLPELMLYRWEDGQPVAWYPVSVGRIASRWHTPVGTLQVINRAVHPVWHRPSWAGGGVVPPGPRNPLGDRWVGLDRPGYGIHGTNDRTSIGRTVSHGCIRLFPAHIHQLFEQTWVEEPVVITYETVMVGHQDGIVYLAVFPDVYARGTNAPSAVRERLAGFGLGEALSGPALEARLHQADGVARPLLGSHMTVKINGSAPELTIGPTIRDGESYLPLRDMANALGAEVTWDVATNTAQLQKDGRMVTFTAGNQGEGFIALDAMFVPVRRLVEGLGGAVDFAENTILLRL